MDRNRLKDISLFTDVRAVESGIPGIRHTFMSSLATALNYILPPLDPVQLMGSSGFAFRIFINETFCPSAMSIFNFSAIIPEAVEQANYHCTYISRLWDESDQESKRRKEAHKHILLGIDNGRPSIVWDIADSEWGLIIGYDGKIQAYDTMFWDGQPSKLSFKRLGKNGIDILSVAIPGSFNQRNQAAIRLNSLRMAVNHAEQREWTDRPRYQNGLAAYDLWAAMYDRFPLILKAGEEKELSQKLPDFVLYYAEHYYSARWYAYQYLESIADDSELLLQAALAYKQVTLALKPVYEIALTKEIPSNDNLSNLASQIRLAKKAEEAGINFVKEYLKIIHIYL